jgi:hypothetical protein
MLTAYMAAIAVDAIDSPIFVYFRWIPAHKTKTINGTIDSP